LDREVAYVPTRDKFDATDLLSVRPHSYINTVDPRGSLIGAL